MGLTTMGTIGAQTSLTLEEAAARVQTIADTAHVTDPGLLVLCHGGAIGEPHDVGFILSRTRGIAGFFGASSVERLPAERAITENMRRLKALATGEEYIDARRGSA